MTTHHRIISRLATVLTPAPSADKSGYTPPHRTLPHQASEAPRSAAGGYGSLNRYMGMTGSAARFSTGMNTSAATTEKISRPIILRRGPLVPGCHPNQWLAMTHSYPPSESANQGSRCCVSRSRNGVRWQENHRKNRRDSQRQGSARTPNANPGPQ